MASTTALTELEDLRLFMQERVQEYDESIDTSLGGSFDSIVIQPLITRLGPDPYNTPIRDFILGRLEVEFPDLVIQDGEPIDDYAVKIMQILLEAFRRQIRTVSLNQSLANPESLNEREADNLAANFFIRRKLGGYSVGIARLYYSAPQFALVTPNNPVSDANGLQFYPVENQAIQADRMLFNEENGLFYFDIVVRASAQGASYNIAANTLTSIDGAPGVVKVTNKRSFTEGDDKEDTVSFIERVEQSLTEKSLVTTRGINARLTDTFESVRLIQVIGFGDPEMQRDIITGTSQSSPYAAARLDITVGSYEIDLDLSVTAPLILADGTQHTSFFEANVRAGDIVEFAIHDTALESFYQTEIEEVISDTKIRVTDPQVATLTTIRALIRRPDGLITISDIPGGILQPVTQAGTIQIVDGQVHIGGALDVFIRAGDPQQRDITLEGILDAAPLRFGVDLETFGSKDDQFIHITEKLETYNNLATAAVPLLDKYGVSTPTDELVIKQHDDHGTGGSSDDTYPWVPTEDDVGRYVQLLGGNTGPDWGTFEITEIVGEEYFRDHAGTWHRGIRIKIDTSMDYESGSTTGPFLTATPGANQGNFDLFVRLAEKVSIKNRVRDRDGSSVVVAQDDPNPGDPVIVGGVDYETIGVQIGDSAVIETGEDAGIYSIRRILSWLNDNDTLILDRDLSKTVQPVGSGGGTGLRYRIADELNVDLVSPKITKIPLGSVFAGGDLSTVAGSENISVTGTTNFLLAGVEEGDTLEILEGDNAGRYGITSVGGTTLSLDTTVPNTGFAQQFSVYKAFTGVNRPLVRVKEIELLDSNSQPTGIKIPYGGAIDGRIRGILSNRAEGNIVEKYTGQLQDNGEGLVDLYDPNVDFRAEGVENGHRLNILDGASIGNYTIIALGADPGIGLTDNYIRVAPVADGGTLFRQAATATHYSIGLPSSGFVRLYFLEPTSVEVQTGLAGGRIQYEEEGNPKVFRFSETSGHTTIPSGSSGEDNPRDLRVVRNWDAGGGLGYRTIVEFTDDTRPGVFELELKEGDVFEVNEQIPFRDSGGDTFAELGVFGKPAGLRTIAGSNLVKVPVNSLIDFVQMNSVFPLGGQTLIIDEGPDAGIYVIEAVEDSKTLRLNTVMTATTEDANILDQSGPRDGVLTDDGDKTRLYDATDGGILKSGVQAGHFVTIFESTRGDIDGTWEISDILETTPDTVELDTKGDLTEEGSSFPALDPFSIGTFSWARTISDTLVEQPFRIYRDVPTEFEVYDVATKRSGIVSTTRRGTITGIGPLDTLEDADVGFVIGAKRGDLLEILAGPSAGVYHLSTDTVGRTATIQTNPPFAVASSDVPYRIWGGVHGSRRMVTLGPKDSSNGRLIPGDRPPYRVLRPGLLRLSSTEMQDNTDGTLYYVDIQIESQGAGDDLNLDAGTRMVPTSGVKADGYTYSVENENLTYSVFEEVSLNFERRFLPIGNSDSPENLTEVSGRNLQVTYETSTPVRLVDDLLRSDLDRPVNADPIARHFLPTFLFTQINYAGGASESEIGADMEDYVNSLGAEDEIRVSDLEAFLHRRGATFIRHPIELVTVTHDLGRKLVVNRSDNVLGGTNDVPYNGTGRISAFFADVDQGLTLVRES